GYKNAIPAKLMPPPVVARKTEPLKVLCVDDSPVIHALLKKIFLKEEGFEIVGSCKNGLEALKWIQSGNKADVITLDIHMPELDGVGFLEQSKGLEKPPVVILSSVNREDPALGQKVLQLGAFDYVEKPSLENLGQASNEIRAKVRLAILGSKKASSTVSSQSSSQSSSIPAPAAASEKKKVLIVDDSPTIRQLLIQVMSVDPSLFVAGEAELPTQVEALIQQHKPDVITLDIHMPEMDGVTLLKKIFPKYHIPTVMISSISKEEGPQVLMALESGAVDYIQKPSFKDLRAVAQDIRDRIRTAAMAQLRSSQRVIRKVTSKVDPDCGALILLGASTGGTEALSHVLRSMPQEIPPILIVQHIPPVFSAAFAQRLNQLCPFEVREAKDGDEVVKNLVLIAPGGKQMGIKIKNGKLFVEVNEDAPVNRHKPSVDYLFQSASQLNHPHLVAGLLTGMGSDGARGMKVLKD
ncbi:MAG: chemotaxis-specific protein-glutamate methyltransferase CheB, partial [Pseudobdellovibrionaceae bacterium]